MPAGRLGSREGAGLVPMAKHMKSSNLPPSVGRLRPLGQTVLSNNGWVKACKAHHEASVKGQKLFSQSVSSVV